jgi:hypothetical protein
LVVLHATEAAERAIAFDDSSVNHLLDFMLNDFGTGLILE